VPPLHVVGPATLAVRLAAMDRISCYRCATLNAESSDSCRGCGARLPADTVLVATGETTPLDGPTPPRDFPGTERFEILRCLGVGGMGVVYEARDRQLERHVALKTMRSVAGPLLLQFKNEFRALADLNHPNLVQLDELFHHDGQWFFTMELVRGPDFMRHV